MNPNQEKLTVLQEQLIEQLTFSSVREIRPFLQGVFDKIRKFTQNQVSETVGFAMISSIAYDGDPENPTGDVEHTHFSTSNQTSTYQVAIEECLKGISEFLVERAEEDIEEAEDQE